MEMKFNIYGSPSSADCDVMVFVDEMPTTIQSQRELIVECNNQLQQYFAKNVDCHLAKLSEDGTISAASDGTIDEVNNSIIDTFYFHTQYFPLFVESRIDRDVELKIKRCVRCILTFFSRTDLRTNIKFALKDGRVSERLKICKDINFVKFTDFGSKNKDAAYIYKTIAFQLIQTILLIKGIEIYTKEDAVKYFPKLSNFINRIDITTHDLINMQSVYEEFIKLANNYTYTSETE